ncbi:MAG: efflux RND transporter periplasmic adaptor subunit [Candidatus Brocadiia bacterium]
MKMNAEKVGLIFVVTLALIGGTVVWSGARGDSEEDKSQKKKGGGPQHVEVEVAREGDIARTLKVTGEVVATNTVVIAATKEGPISYCPWREGDQVEAGKKLVEIDRQVHRAEVRQAESALKVARAKLADLKAGPRPEEIDQARTNVRRWEATLEEARTAYERQQNLQAKEFTSEQSVDQAREKMEVAKAELANAKERLRMLEAGPTRTEIAVQEANVKEARAKLDLARAHLEECLITAPFDGTITQVHVRPGDLATPRSPLIELFDHNSLVVRFSVPEAYAGAVHPGLTVEARLDAVPEETFRGEVVRVFPQLDASMRTRTVEARLEESQPLMPHQFARITLEFESATGAVIVPAEALRETPGGSWTAFVVKNGKAVQRTVDVGIKQKQRVQILKGIKAGEQVVVTSGKLKDGGRVSVIGE